MTSFAEGPERNRALGIYGAASGSGAAVGVLLGGVITSYLGWSWVFFINVPVGIAAALVAPALLVESRADLGHRHFDARGAVTVTGGLMLFVYALSRAPQHGWSAPSTIALLAGSLAAIAAFVRIELRSPWPLLPMRMFRNRTLSAANGTMAVIGAVMFSEFFVLTLYLQDVLHYSAVQSGAAFTAFAGMVVLVSNLAQPIVARLGVRGSLVTGLVLSLASLASIVRLPLYGHYFWDLFPGFLVGGAGVGLSIVPVTIASLTGVQRSDAGVASGLVNTSRQIGGAIGIAATSAVVASTAGLHHGLQDALYVLTALQIGAVLLAFAGLRPARQRVTEPAIESTPILREAA
jgi:MFS family permease